MVHDAILVGGTHPLAKPLAAILRGSAVVPYAAPAEPPRAAALVLLPTPWPRDPADVNAVVDDLDVAYRWLHGWAPWARDHGGGALLYILDLDGVYGSAERLLLAERDSALLAQARSMALELGCMGVRANALALGPLAGSPAGNLAENPLRRVGTWAEAAAVAAFLLSDGAAHLSGQLLVCAGGANLGRVPA